MSQCVPAALRRASLLGGARSPIRWFVSWLTALRRTGSEIGGFDGRAASAGRGPSACRVLGPQFLHDDAARVLVPGGRPERTRNPPERCPTAQSNAFLARVGRDMATRAGAIGPSGPRCLSKPRPTDRPMRKPLGKLVVQPFAEIGRLAAWGEPQGHHLGAVAPMLGIIDLGPWRFAVCASSGAAETAGTAGTAGVLAHASHSLVFAALAKC